MWWLLPPVDGADAGHRVSVTHALGQQTVADLPGEHGRVLTLVICYLLHHLGRGHLGLRATDHPWFNTTCLIVPGEREREREREVKFSNSQILYPLVLYGVNNKHVPS